MTDGGERDQYAYPAGPLCVVALELCNRLPVDQNAIFSLSLHVLWSFAVNREEWGETTELLMNGKTAEALASAIPIWERGL